MSSPLPSSFDGDTEFYEENRWQKLTRRIREEPLIPIGVALTCAALYGATKSIRAGDHNRTQRMFRARILAQGFTIVAMLAGSMYWQSDREKRKVFEGLLEEKKAKEKQEAWIRELEARDEEERQLREAMKRRRARGEKGIMTELKDGETRAAVRKAVEESKAAAEKTIAKDSKLEPTPAVAPPPSDPGQKSSGILASVQGLIWGKK